MPELKITSAHLERDAYLYIRQSTPRQVLENVESTRLVPAVRFADVRATCTSLACWPAPGASGATRQLIRGAATSTPSGLVTLSTCRYLGVSSAVDAACAAGAEITTDPASTITVQNIAIGPNRVMSIPSSYDVLRLTMRDVRAHVHRAATKGQMSQLGDRSFSRRPRPGGRTGCGTARRTGRPLRATPHACRTRQSAPGRPRSPCPR